MLLLLLLLLLLLFPAKNLLSGCALSTRKLLRRADAR